MDNLWTDSNRFNKRSLQLNTRLACKSKLNQEFFDSNMRRISRLSVSWLVDGAEPNPIYFNQPDLLKITDLLKDSNIEVYNDIPFIKRNLSVSTDLGGLSARVKRVIQTVWYSQNPTLRMDQIQVFLEKEPMLDEDHEFDNVSLIENDRVRRMAVERNEGINYFVGVDDADFDVNDVEEPMEEVVRRALKEHVPQLKFLSSSHFEDETKTRASVSDTVQGRFNSLFLHTHMMAMVKLPQI